jgi:hypothetical protein
LVVVLRLLFAAVLVLRRRYLIVVPRPIPAASRMYLIVAYKPLPAAPLVVRCMYMAVVPRPMPVAEASRSVLDAGLSRWFAPAAKKLGVVPRPMPAAHRRYLIVVYSRLALAAQQAGV